MRLSVDEQNKFRIEAQNQQELYYPTISPFFRYGPNEKPALSLMVALSCFGTPNCEQENQNIKLYTSEQQKKINLIVKALEQCSTQPGANEWEQIELSRILLSIKLLDDRPNALADAAGTSYQPDRVQSSSSGPCLMEIRNNQLPPCLYVCEIGQAENNNTAKVYYSPSSRKTTKFFKGLDTAGTIVSLAALGITAVALAPVALTAVGVAAVPGVITSAAALAGGGAVATGSTVGAVASSAWQGGRSVATLVDRKKHNQTVNPLKDPEALNHCIGAACGAVGAASIGGGVYVAKNAAAKGMSGFAGDIGKLLQSVPKGELPKLGDVILAGVARVKKVRTAYTTAMRVEKIGKFLNMVGQLATMQSAIHIGRIILFKWGDDDCHRFYDRFLTKSIDLDHPDAEIFGYLHELAITLFCFKNVLISTDELAHLVLVLNFQHLLFPRNEEKQRFNDIEFCDLVVDLLQRGGMPADSSLLFTLSAHPEIIARIDALCDVD
ncbi:hypothetical protein Ddc_13103 [Ditylenchus destructor]|nr:hypothetical protein Ddc_13103 [Ditylenchus destructor]